MRHAARGAPRARFLASVARLKRGQTTFLPLRGPRLSAKASARPRRDVHGCGHENCGTSSLDRPPPLNCPFMQVRNRRARVGKHGLAHRTTPRLTVEHASRKMLWGADMGEYVMLRLAPLAWVLLIGSTPSTAQDIPSGHRHPSFLIAQAAKSAAEGGASAKTSADTPALIADALSAAPPMIRDTAKVMEWDGKVLKEGSGEYTCLPTHADKRNKGGKEPMCLDKQWLAWGDAWMNKKPVKIDAVGIAYMMAGDNGASNVDPYAMSETNDDSWIVEGPHVMVVVPDPKQLDALPTDPKQGGAYVMWKGTPYAHIMVPVGERPSKR